MSSFFNWFFFSLTVGAIAGVTFFVWISTNKGWDWSFTACTIAVFFAIVFVSMGKPLYRSNVPSGSPLLRILQVPNNVFACSLNIQNYMTSSMPATVVLLGQLYKIQLQYLVSFFVDQLKLNTFYLFLIKFRCLLWPSEIGSFLSQKWRMNYMRFNVTKNQGCKMKFFRGLVNSGILSDSLNLKNNVWQ